MPGEVGDCRDVYTRLAAPSYEQMSDIVVPDFLRAFWPRTGPETFTGTCQ